jgi:hypothetical protein
MAEELAQIQVTAVSRILKYAEGADPAVDEPYEVVEQSRVYTGQEALDLLAAAKAEEQAQEPGEGE